MRRRPRWVVDTNVLVSAFLWRGIPGRVIDMAGEKEVQLVTIVRAIKGFSSKP